MILSILVPSTPDRQPMLDELLSNLKEQIFNCKGEKTIEILTDITDTSIPTGAKRQRLLEQATGRYVTHIDSDDEISEDYIKEILKATFQEPDVISFYGYMTTNGSKRENFKIGKDLPYITIKDAYGNSEYLRFNNHLSPVLRSIALQIGFEPIWIQEDYKYALKLQKSGLIKKEVLIEKYLYHYRYKTQK